MRNLSLWHMTCKTFSKLIDIINLQIKIGKNVMNKRYEVNQMRLRILLYMLVITFMVAGNALATSFGTNITIWDNEGVMYEDNETEPGMVQNQDWDLEAFFLEGTTLTLVGGYDFANGELGFESGDIFIDVDGDAQWGNDSLGGSNNSTTTNIFGYDYAIDIDFVNNSYSVYEISAATLVNVFYSQNRGSNPWELLSGEGNLLLKGSLVYYNSDSVDEVDGLSDTLNWGGVSDGTRYALSVDLGFLDAGTEFISKFTMECGNDNIVGKGSVPDASIMFLLGPALLTLGMLGRRKVKSE